MFLLVINIFPGKLCVYILLGARYYILGKLATNKFNLSLEKVSREQVKLFEKLLLNLIATSLNLCSIVLIK